MTEYCCCRCGCTKRTLSSRNSFCYECEPFQGKVLDNKQKEHFRKQFSLREKIQRKGFSESAKRQILKKQNLTCAICGKFSQTWDFDHIDNDRSNNDTSNCQALCPNCHAIKSRNEN